MGLRKRIAIGFALIVFVFFALIVAMGVMRIYRLFNPYSDQRIVGPTTITDEWTEIELKDPLTQNRVTQYVVFVIAADQLRHQDPSREPRLLNGSLVTFEVELIDRDGKIYALTTPAGDGHSEVWRTFDLGTSKQMSKDTVFPRIRFRTSQPIKCSEIIWRSYDPRDFK